MVTGAYPPPRFDPSSARERPAIAPHRRLNPYLGILILTAGACGSSSSAANQPRVHAQAGISLPGSDAALPPTVAVAAPSLRTATLPLPHDIAQLRSVSSVRISPDASHIAYIVRIPRFDPDAKPNPKDTKAGWTIESQAFIVATEAGATPRQLTSGKHPPSQLRWSPDGSTLGFVRTRGGRDVIHLLPMSGGEARTIKLDKELRVQRYEWSPDGNQLAFTAPVPLSDDERAARWRRGGASEFEADWTPAGLYTVPVAGGKATRVSPDPEQFGHVLQFAWSPDGEHLAVATSASPDPYLAWTSNRLHVVSASDRQVSHAVESSPSIIGQLAWSPDGRYLAYEWAEESLSMLNQLRVRAIGGDGAKSWNAAAKLDPTLTGFAWADSTSIIAHVYEKTRSKLYRLSHDGSTVRDLGALDRVLTGSFDRARDGRFMAVTSSTAQTPWAPTLLDTADMSMRVVADVNPQVADWDLAETEVVSWKNAEGVTVEGILHRSPHAQPGTPAPLIVFPHGGPDSVSVDGFHSFAQYLAARGYSVLRPNYRGGFGYGSWFYQANRGRLGEIEFMDIEAGVDALIAAGTADPERLFYGGWSWGGYITTWTITKTHRYRAAVVGAGVVDVVAQYVTSDINHGVVADWEFRGRPWRDPQAFARSNPALSLGAIKTPTLILHGREDRRVAFMHGTMLYRALRDADTEVKFWAYPREPHSFREPAHIAHMLEAWAGWYDAHLPE